MIFTILMIIVTAIGQSISPIMTNNLALTQMQNSNEMYMLMNTYSKVRPIVNLVYVFIVCYFMGTIARDIHKFVKTIETENTEV
jgi:hypothetical protein